MNDLPLRCGGRSTGRQCIYGIINGMCNDLSRGISGANAEMMIYYAMEQVMMVRRVHIFFKIHQILECNWHGWMMRMHICATVWSTRCSEHIIYLHNCVLYEGKVNGWLSEVASECGGCYGSTIPFRVCVFRSWVLGCWETDGLMSGAPAWLLLV